MKLLPLFMLFALFCAAPAVRAEEQGVNKKFGKPTMQELEMTVYEPEPDASAVILYKEGNGHFYYEPSEGFKVEYEFMTRIKILKQEGTEYADVEIPYYHTWESGEMKDEVLNVQANSYNLVNGKIEKTKLKRDLIFSENVYGNYYVTKFSVPNVKAGSVIEYKYKIQTSRIPFLRSWYPQADIPTVSSMFDIKIPTYFRFNLSTKGYEKINVKKEYASDRFRLTNDLYADYVTCQSDRIIITADSLPSLRDDEYTMGINDYIAHVDFEMSGVDMPGMGYRAYSHTWEDVDRTIMDAGMKDVMEMKNPYPELAAEVNAQSTAVDKALAASMLVAGRIKWDGSFQVLPEDFKEVKKMGSGSNAAINTVVMCLLRDAGVRCCPFVLRLRSNGMLSTVFPSYDDIDTFVVGFRDEADKWHFLDGSYSANGVDVLPVDMLVSNARLMGNYSGERWFSLDNLCKNVSQSMIQATIDENFNIQCQEQQRISGQLAADFRKSYAQKADSLAFVNDLAAENGIELTSMSMEGVNERSMQIVLESSYSVPATATDSLIYVVPTIVPIMSENPFTQETRKLPVIYPYRAEQIMSVHLTIPEGYTVEELPKRIVASTQKNEFQFSFNPVVLGDKIIITTKIARNEVLFPFNLYGMLRQIHTYIVDKNNEMIVLRKL